MSDPLRTCKDWLVLILIRFVQSILPIAAMALAILAFWILMQIGHTP